MIVFVCSPLQAFGDYTLEDNIRIAHDYCKAVLKLGHFPLAPHTILTQYLDDTDPEQRQLGMNLARYLLGRCDEVWVCGGHLSSGMLDEIKLALKLGIQIRHEFSNLDELLDEKLGQPVQYIEALDQLSSRMDSQLQGVSKLCPHRPPA